MPRALLVGPNGAGAVQVAGGEPVHPGLGWRTAMAVASGLFLAAAFPSVDLEPLAWIGLVPLLVAVRGCGPRRAFRLGWTTGFVFYLATTYWVGCFTSRSPEGKPCATHAFTSIRSSFLSQVN